MPSVKYAAYQKILVHLKLILKIILIINNNSNNKIFSKDIDDDIALHLQLLWMKGSHLLSKLSKSLW